MQCFRPILTEAGITEQQWRVLRTLYDYQQIDAATLAKEAQILAPSLTRMLKVLESTDMIVRMPDPQEQRRQQISLSAHGRSTVGRLGPEIEGVYQELEQQVGPGLLEDLYERVEALIKRVEETQKKPRSGQ